MSNMTSILEIAGSSAVNSVNPEYMVHSKILNRAKLWLELINHHKACLSGDGLFSLTSPTDAPFSDIYSDFHLFFCVCSRLVSTHIVEGVLGDLVGEYLLNSSLDNGSSSIHTHCSKVPAKTLIAKYGLHRPVGKRDEAVRDMHKAQRALRKAELIQRITFECQRAHDAGWYMVFDTLTLNDEFYVKCAADSTLWRKVVTRYYDSIAEAVMVACGVQLPSGSEARLKAVRRLAPDYLRWCQVSEYGSETHRLHCHNILMLRSLPSGSLCPNNYGYGPSGHSPRHASRGNPLTRQEIHAFKKFWDVGITSPKAVRYHGDSYFKLGWADVLDASGKSTSGANYNGVALYLAKYVTKDEGSEYSSQFHKGMLSTFRSRGFGANLPSMSSLSIADLAQLVNLHHTTTPYVLLISRAAKKEAASRLETRDPKTIYDAMPYTPDLIAERRRSAYLGITSRFTVLDNRLIKSQLSEAALAYIEQPCFRFPPK